MPSNIAARGCCATANGSMNPRSLGLAPRGAVFSCQRPAANGERSSYTASPRRSVSAEAAKIADFYGLHGRFWEPAEIIADINFDDRPALDPWMTDHDITLDDVITDDLKWS